MASASFMTQVSREEERGRRDSPARAGELRKGGSFFRHIGEFLVPFKNRPPRGKEVTVSETSQKPVARPSRKWLLPPLAREDAHKKTLVLDLDETLIHSGFRAVPEPDYVLNVEMDDVIHTIWVQKRPWVDYFLQKMSRYYEIVVFTASLSVYANPLLDLLDKDHTIKHRLFRESCTFYQGSYVKDLTLLNRDMSDVFIVDNSPLAYRFQPQNAIAILSWFDDMDDTEILGLVPILENLAHCSDVVAGLHELRMTGKIPPATGCY